MEYTQQYYMPLNKEVELFFNFENCLVETIFDCNIAEEKQEYGCLIITIQVELKEYESTTDLAIFSRPKFLNMLGIISFLLDEPFDVFSPNIQTSPGKISSITEKFINEKLDQTEHLREFINKLNVLELYEKSLIFSILDRWRKAYYLENESEDNFLYDDESTLAYFHVLELLSDVYAKELNKKANLIIEEFSQKYNSEILSLHNTSLTNKNIQTTKLLKSLLNKDVSINSKILYLLKKFNLYNMDTVFLVKKLIESRNSVSHGRRVYYDKAIFPVKPFYPLINDELYTLEILRIFISKIICCHLNIALFEDKWNEIKEILIPDDFIIKKFVKETPIPIEELTTQQKNIVFGGLNYFIFSKRIKIREVINIYKFYLETEDDNKEFLFHNSEAIVLLYENNIEKIEEILKIAIFNMDKHQCMRHFKFRDMLYYLDFHGFKAKKLEKLIISKEIR